MIPTTAEAPSGKTGEAFRTILVVEDEEAIRTSTTEFLRDCSFIVIEAGDVIEARNVLRAWHIDLVFSDINLPNRESGFALEKWIRHYHPDVKVLLTSGYPQLYVDTRELQQPMIQKPYSYSLLLRRIDRAFEALHA